MTLELRLTALAPARILSVEEVLGYIHSNGHPYCILSYKLAAMSSM